MRAIIPILLVLACSGGQTGDTPTATRTTITIASWNIQVFGPAKLADPARMDIIVKTLKRYDITAIQEVREAGQTLAPTLIGLMNADGSNYNYVISNRLGHSTQKEQYLYVYDDSVIDHVAGREGYGFEPNDEYSREPFYAMFKAGNFDFYLMAIHTSPSNLNVSIPALDTTYEHLQYGTSGQENDIIFLGDFNAKSPSSTVTSTAVMTDLATVPNIVFLFDEATNTNGDRAYDNIVFQSNYTTEYTGEHGTFDFWTPEGLPEDVGDNISDHMPIWAMFNTSGEDDD